MALVLAFMRLYSIFNLQLLLSILKKKPPSGIETQDRNDQWYQHLLNLFAIFNKSNTEGTHFRLMFACFSLM